MTVRFEKKNRKWRGRTSRGWGMKKKRRGGGSRGGRGFSGMHKHRFSMVVSKKPDWYGKKGFHPLGKRDKTINVGDLHKIAKGADIDLKSMGYDKLLSRGLVHSAYNVKIGKFTERAKAKIEKAGGKIIVEKTVEKKAKQ
jgi:large subunit ribosomal protein L15